MGKGVSLVSGGLDSTLMALLIHEQGLEQVPLFIDYGQLAADQEWMSCRKSLCKLGLPLPTRLDVSGYGKTISCGITDATKRLVEDAFLPCRNLLFLVAGAAMAMKTGGSFVSIGLLSEEFALFPDQRQAFVDSSERTLKLALGQDMKVLVPLLDFSKADVIVLASSKGIEVSTVYSCHAGLDEPCGRCISCRERISAMEILSKSMKGTA